MNLKINSLPCFARDVKRLLKRHKNLPQDLKTLCDVLSRDPHAGIRLSPSLYKIRLANTSARSGKSSGFRVIYYYTDHQENLYLLKIYSKSELPSIDENRLKSILQEHGLS
ncbi:hypothetical protein [Desulfonatronum thioautotrophicum]|uniref:hypothetical protein n=1 Tax=Desulfonatronum thioautotrophicum TaxID=617001 RepID=UPI0005EB5570|nr:hypothetical protein [Desulfonatronum thioautotrophicum]